MLNVEFDSISFLFLFGMRAAAHWITFRERVAKQHLYQKHTQKYAFNRQLVFTYRQAKIGCFMFGGQENRAMRCNEDLFIVSACFVSSSIIHGIQINFRTRKTMCYALIQLILIQSHARKNLCVLVLFSSDNEWAHSLACRQICAKNSCIMVHSFTCLFIDSSSMHFCLVSISWPFESRK